MTTQQDQNRTILFVANTVGDGFLPFYVRIPLKQFVDGQIAQGRYSSASEYVRELIRADEKRKAEEQLEAKLLEGLNSPESKLTPADWSAIRKEALAQLEARKKQR